MVGYAGVRSAGGAAGGGLARWAWARSAHARTRSAHSAQSARSAAHSARSAHAWVGTPRLASAGFRRRGAAMPRHRLLLGAGVASAGLGACCRCDGEREQPKKKKKEEEEAPKKKKKKKKKAPEKKAEETETTETDKTRQSKKTETKKEAGTANEKKAVATPRVDPLLELRHRQRMIFISGSISDAMAKTVIADLLYLDALEDDGAAAGPAGPKPIQLVINSSGGVVTAGLAIYDVMQYVRSPVHTLCIGHASSMAAILLAAGAPGHRRSLPHARIMIHSASGGYGRSKVEDVLAHAEELKAKNDLLAAILARHLGLSVEKVAEMWRVDNYMTPQRALEAGIVDEIVSRRPGPSGAATKGGEPAGGGAAG